jgi:glycosyltransferase involved in cell wall biosynthesis
MSSLNLRPLYIITLQTRDGDILYRLSMYILWTIIIVLTFLYFMMIILFQIGFNRLREFCPTGGVAVTPVSVVIPVRNEKENIAGLLNSLSQQDYPADSFEIIMVDDHSDDGTPGVLNNLGNGKISLIKMTGGTGKIEALAEGIRHAKNQVIIVIDADCRFNRGWLSAMSGYFAMYDSRVLIGPVVCERGTCLFHRMQSLEFLSLAGITAGAAGLNNPIMGNGANLMFQKDIFFDFMNSRRQRTVSGDDVFLIHWAKKNYPGKVHFLLSRQAIALTPPHDRLMDFIDQRLRWASKGRYYRDISILTTAAIVYIFCMVLVLLLLASVFYKSLFYAALFMLLSKSLADLIFLTDVAGKFRQTSLLKVFLPVQIIYPFYIFIIGTFGQFIRFRWKGREYHHSVSNHAGRKYHT